MSPTEGPTAGADLDELVDVAVAAALSAGRMLAEAWEAGPTRVESKSTATDLVSDLDRASETLITGLIAQRRPDDGVLGEEGADAGGSSGLRWIIDPLDGTINYLYGLPAWSVSVAVEAAAGTLVGAVHDPVRGETFLAVSGRGATLNGRPIAVSSVTEPAVSLVATGFSYDASVRSRQADVLRSVLPAVRDIRRAGSAALDLCSVAAGRVDAYYESGTRVWDRAAGGLIAAEAGATVGDLSGGPPSDGITFAAAPGVAGRLAALLRDAGADRVLG